MRQSLSAILTLSAVALTLSGQTDQQIFATVIDDSGAALVSASVAVTNEGTGATRTVTVSNEGNYVVAGIPNGTYTVSATAPGFKKFTVQGVAVNVSSRVEVNARLVVGQVNESVEVTAQSLQVETGTAEVGHLVSGTEALGLQLNGRNFVQLIALTPGASPTYTSSFRGLYGPYGSLGAAFSVSGSRPDAATFMVNNVDNKDPGGPSSNNYVNVSPDFISEFKTIAASQSAQYGLNAGATITMALKSGVKEFHGSAYEYFRNDAIQARSF